MELIDSHAHLTFPDLSKDIDGVLDRAAQAGVSKIITVGESPASSRDGLSLASQYDNVYATIGYHPHGAAKYTEAELAELPQLASKPKMVAIGEIGLDYYYDFSDRKSQHRVFCQQLEFAATTDFPLVIHCREAVDDTIPILTEYGYDNKNVVFHCFTGTQAEADRLAERGWRISFTGIVTFRKSTDLHAIAKTYPLDWIMLETDCPYLSPEPVRNKRTNEPAHVAHTARFLAELRGESFDTFAERTTRNTIDFFGLD